MEFPCKDCLCFPMCRSRAVFPYSTTIGYGINLDKLTFCELFITWWAVNWTNEKSRELERTFYGDM